MYNLHHYYRCTRQRIPRSLLTVGTCFSLAPIRCNSTIMHFVRRVVSVDFANGYIIDHFGCKFILDGRDVCLCVRR